MMALPRFKCTVPFLVCLLALFVLVAAGPTAAQEAAPSAEGGAPSALRLATIDLEAIGRHAKVFQSIREQLKAYERDYQAASKSEEQELREANQALARQRTVLAPDAFAEERRKFEKRVFEFQRLEQQRRQNLSEVRGRALVEANQAVKGIVDAFAKENQLALILRADMLAFFHPALDITEIILEKLDEKVPSVKVSKPAAPTQPSEAGK